MARLALVLIAAGALAAPAHAAPVRVGAGPLHALTAANGSAFAVVEWGRGDRAFALARSSGRRPRLVRVFGQRNALFPDVAASPEGRLMVSWGRAVSGGESYEVAGPTGPVHVLGLSGSGPARLDLSAPDEQPRLAYPDREGELSWHGTPLTSDAPARRHLPLDVDAGVILDVAQTRERTELRVHGEDAPQAPLRAMPGLRTVEGTVAVAGGRVHVAWVDSGQARIAVAPRASDGVWTIRPLPGRAAGLASVAVVGRRILVAYSARGDIHVWRGGRRAERLTRGAARDSDPRIAVDRAGAVFVGWTRREPRDPTPDALLERVG